MEDAMELFKLPREVAVFEEKPVVVNIGRFGPYIAHDKKFISLPKGEDPYTVSGERAIELIILKREADANKMIKLFDTNPDIQILNGRFGAYIKAGKKNVKIPKGKAPEELTLEECLVLAENTPEKKGGRFFKKKK
jgi:DNA topoisomerase-1